MELIEAHLLLHRELWVYIKVKEKTYNKFSLKNNYFLIFFSRCFYYIHPATQEFLKSLQTPIRTRANTFNRSQNTARNLGRCIGEIRQLYADYNCEE